ncbi:DUF3300 domain-containing protein [Superficieibacter electus]|uniref:DUF3300 domain-containing protein n=1 Tax=Superficieibacter electus TaxID=2022662 RepID=A0A2P5GMF0_9ENTR|nr:DUF3300 domain-containing protein [Superficieibacter electus]POP46973.1 DUF3300 domain-containing protein [Superficieibacter electus]
MTLPFKPHVIALACSLGLFAASGVLYVKSRSPVTTSVSETVPDSVPAPAAAATFTPAQIDQWVAPIALYPDALLSQVLMASTYPASVVQAVQWSKDHPTLQGDAAIKAVSNQPWDASVKSLVAFPQLVALMGQDPQWVENLGNAFLAQPQDVMDSVQKLRALAQQTGTLKTTPQQKVTSESTVASTAQNGTTTVIHSTPRTIIKIEPADPQVVYIPTYNPTTVYGSWPNTTYPPVYLPPPPGEQFASSFVKGFGYSLGVATTYALFSSIDWDHDDHHHHDDDDHHHDDHDYHNGGYIHNGDNININVNNYNRITGEHLTDNTRIWQHNPAYRNGVPYINNAHPVNVSGGLSATASPDSRATQRQTALTQLQEKTGKSLPQSAATASRDTQRQAASKQLEQIAQRNNYRGYDTSNTQRDAARMQLQQNLANTTPDQRQQLRDNAQQRLNTSTQAQRQQARENLQQRLSSTTSEQRQERRDNVQQRLNSSTPEQRQERRENVQQRLNSSTPEHRQERRENVQQRLSSTTSEQRQERRENVQQRLNSSTPEQRQERRDNVQQRLNSSTPEQRQERRENVQQRRANALSGNDSRSPSWRSQQNRGNESRRLENRLSSEQRSAVRERVAERRHH